MDVRKDDSPSLKCCLLLLVRVLSGWWCEPPEAGWQCPCLHILTMQWSLSGLLARDVPSPQAALHIGCVTKTLQHSKEKETELAISAIIHKLNLTAKVHMVVKRHWNKNAFCINPISPFETCTSLLACFFSWNKSIFHITLLWWCNSKINTTLRCCFL